MKRLSTSLHTKADYSSECEAIRSIASSLGITWPESLRHWMRQAEVDGGAPLGRSSDEAA